MPTLMHRDVKSPEFISTLAFFLQKGYALVPTSRMLRDEEAEDAVLAPFVQALQPDEADINRPAEVQCTALLKRKAASCFRFWSEDTDEISDIMKNVPQCALWFFGRRTSEMPLIHYLHYVIPRLHCSDEAIVMAVVYIARAVKKGIPFTPRSAHRIVAAALLVAIKTQDERPYAMSTYARITGMPRDKLIKAEAAMLELLDFATFVTPAEYLLMLFSFRSCHVQLNTAEFGTWYDVSMGLGIPGAQPEKAEEETFLAAPVTFVKSVKDVKNLRALRRSTRSTSISSFGSDGVARTVPLTLSARSPECTPESAADCWPSLLFESGP